MNPVSKETAYRTAAGDEVYMLQAVLRGGLSSGDPGLQSIVQSFRLISPAPPMPLSAMPRSAAFRAGYVVGRLLALAIIPCGILSAWLIYLAITRRKRS